MIPSSTQTEFYDENDEFYSLWCSMKPLILLGNYIFLLEILQEEIKLIYWCSQVYYKLFKNIKYTNFHIIFYEAIISIKITPCRV